MCGRPRLPRSFQSLLIFSSVIAPDVYVGPPAPQLAFSPSAVWEGCQPAGVSPFAASLAGWRRGAGSGRMEGGVVVRGGAAGQGKRMLWMQTQITKRPLHSFCLFNPSSSSPHPAHKQKMVSHVVKPKARRSSKATSLRNEAVANPKASAQAVFISHQKGRPCLTKCALAQADISRQELEASLSGLFVRLGVEQ